MAQRPDASKQTRWLDLVQRWHRSQLTVREFCERHHVSEASFFSWRRVLRQRGLLNEAADPKATKATPPSSAFVKLTPVEPEPTPVTLDQTRGWRPDPATCYAKEYPVFTVLRRPVQY